MRMIVNPEIIRATLAEPLEPDGRLDEPRARAVARQLDELRRYLTLAASVRGRVAA